MLVACGKVDDDPGAGVPDAATPDAAPCHDSQTFEYTGGAQMFVVPACVTALTIDAYGAEGGTGAGNGSGQNGEGGLGGRAKGTSVVTPGETLVIMVGGKGPQAPNAGSAQGYVGGFNGGGAVREQTNWTNQIQGRSGTGGGASDVRRGGAALVNRIIVAGGAGGGASTRGGGGGGEVGGDGGAGAAAGVNVGGGGGTQTTGGTAVSPAANYPNAPGELGAGGAAYRDGSAAGGGGGGYYGGGGGQFAGGGGGSSYVLGLTDTITNTGVRPGNGVVILTW